MNAGEGRGFLQDDLDYPAWVGIGVYAQLSYFISIYRTHTKEFASRLRSAIQLLFIYFDVMQQDGILLRL